MKPKYKIMSIDVRCAETLEDWQQAYKSAKIAYRNTFKEVQAYCKCELENHGGGYFTGKRDGIRFETEIVLR